eukprot:1152561-Pelagomonas_calceolata.AAC.3
MSKETPDSVPRSGICVLNIGTFEMLSKHFIWQPLFEKAVVNEPSQTLLNTTSTKELMLCLAPQSSSSRLWRWLTAQQHMAVPSHLSGAAQGFHLSKRASGIPILRKRDSMCWSGTTLGSCSCEGWPRWSSCAPAPQLSTRLQGTRAIGVHADPELSASSGSTQELAPLAGASP